MYAGIVDPYDLPRQFGEKPKLLSRKVYSLRDLKQEKKSGPANWARKIGGTAL
jgi:hypothetical protein